MGKTKLERKLKIGHYDSQGKKQGKSNSGHVSKRNKKRSVKQKLDKLLNDGYDDDERE